MSSSYCRYTDIRKSPKFYTYKNNKNLNLLIIYLYLFFNNLKIVIQYQIKAILKYKEIQGLIGNLLIGLDNKLN